MKPIEIKITIETTEPPQLTLPIDNPKPVSPPTWPTIKTTYAGSQELLVSAALYAEYHNPNEPVDLRINFNSLEHYPNTLIIPLTNADQFLNLVTALVRIRDSDEFRNHTPLKI